MMILINILASKIVYVTETYSKMASTLSKKWLTIFCQKAQNFVYFGPYNFVQTSPAFDPNTYQIMHEKTLDFQYLHQHKVPDRKINFIVILALKLFRDTVANANIICSSLFIHYLIRILTPQW